MKTQLSTLILALFIGYLGGLSSQFFHSEPASDHQQTNLNSNDADSSLLSEDPDYLSPQLEALQFRVEQLEAQLLTLDSKQGESVTAADNKTQKTMARGTRLTPSNTPDKDSLIAAGISQDIADDLQRRMSQQAFRRLELQNLIQRNRGVNAQQYRDELRELNQNRISLRTELGEDSYDEYLYQNGQNNRVKVSSVMSGSPAELSGFESDDVILLYDNQKVLNWQDIRRATAEGEIGEYTNVEILRQGARMTIMVPRGTLGVQLDAVLLDPSL